MGVDSHWGGEHRIWSVFVVVAWGLVDVRMTECAACGLRRVGLRVDCSFSAVIDVITCCRPGTPMNRHILELSREDVILLQMGGWGWEIGTGSTFIWVHFGMMI